MSKVVAAVATVHAPFIAGMPQLAPPERKVNVDRGFEQLKEFVAAARPDVILCVATEHITNFLSTNVPPFCIGIGDSNPTQPEFNLPDRSVDGDASFARGLVDFAYRHDFDLSYSNELFLDHGVNLPLHFITPEYKIPVVPLLVNTVWSPMPTVERSHRLGELIAAYVAADGNNKRVLLMATGGISHWVGNEHHGDMNEEFDRWFLKEIASGSNEHLRSLTQEEVEKGGDGANEIRTWVMVSAAAAVGGLKPKVVLDETFVPGWNVSVYQVVWQ